MQRYKWVRLAATGAVLATPGEVVAILLTSGTASQKVILTNDATGAGTALVEVSAVANDYAFVELPGGIQFDTAIYGTLSGTGALAYIAIDG